MNPVTELTHAYIAESDAGWDRGMEPFYFGEEAKRPRPLPRLAIGVAHTRDFLPQEIGRTAMVTETRRAVEEACSQASIPMSELCFVQIKCPLLTPERVAAAERDGATCATDDCYHSMSLSRGASSLVGLRNRLL